ncbi:hypothetical protein Taro_013973 [Colocasia esculenta]|uniref:Uncharacterized protein n=1 Tax=Colocasia esculenta TaxID=4460 RepID=A0A843UDL8_COLES|nr:hypothetical protein [Colocasia esculenta]
MAKVEVMYDVVVDGDLGWRTPELAVQSPFPIEEKPGKDHRSKKGNRNHQPSRIHQSVACRQMQLLYHHRSFILVKTASSSRGLGKPPSPCSRVQKLLLEPSRRAIDQSLSPAAVSKSPPSPHSIQDRLTFFGIRDPATPLSTVMMVTRMKSMDPADRRYLEEDDTPVMKTIKGATMGLAAGTIWGTVVATWYDVPRVERSVALPGLIRTVKLMGTHGLTFAAIGGIYIGVEQLLQKYRMKRDFYNGAAGAFVAGATVLGLKGQIPTLVHVSSDFVEILQMANGVLLEVDSFLRQVILGEEDSEGMERRDLGEKLEKSRELWNNSKSSGKVFEVGDLSEDFVTYCESWRRRSVAVTLTK